MGGTSGLLLLLLLLLLGSSRSLVKSRQGRLGAGRGLVKGKNSDQENEDAALDSSRRVELEFLAGMFDAKASVRIASSGTSIRTSFSRLGSQQGPPPLLEHVQQRWGGTLSPAPLSKVHPGYKLEWSSKADNTRLLTELQPVLHVRRRQVEAALDFLAFDSRLGGREGKDELGARLTALNPRLLPSESPENLLHHGGGEISPAYAAGLLTSSASFEFSDGTIRISCRSPWLSPVLQAALWQICPEFEGESVTTPGGRLSISSTRAYVFLFSIRDEMIWDDSRAAEADALIALYELCGQRGVPASTKDAEARNVLVKRLKELKGAEGGGTPAPQLSPSPSPSSSSLMREEAELQAELHYIEAVEQRNEAQLGSFVDEKHQWESQSQEDRDMLLKKPMVVTRLEEIRVTLTAKGRGDMK